MTVRTELRRPADLKRTRFTSRWRSIEGRTYSWLKASSSRVSYATEDPSGKMETASVSLVSRPLLSKVLRRTRLEGVS